jgi:dihydroxyacetone kinase
MAQGKGLKNVELVVVGDDVSVPRSRGNMVGRRCLAGITLGMLVHFKNSERLMPL